MTRRIAGLVVVAICAALVTKAQADTSATASIQLGASLARDCFRTSRLAGPYRGDRMHGYASCLEAAKTPIRYSSESEKVVDAGLYLAGRYILHREFGHVDQDTYGTLGAAQSQEIEAGYRWAIVYLQNTGITRETACKAIEWIDCKALH
jgi:hypothetical protein